MYECKFNIIHEQDKGASIFNRFFNVVWGYPKIENFQEVYFICVDLIWNPLDSLCNVKLSCCFYSI